VLQAVQQQVAEQIGAQHAGEARVAAELGHRHRHVGGRAAGEGHEGARVAVGIASLGVEID